MKRRERNHLWIFGALGFLAAAAAAAALLFLEYEAYRSQLMTAARPLAAQEGADLSELLKKQPNRFRQGRYEREEWERLEEETGFGISGQLESLAGCLQILTERAQK